MVAIFSCIYLTIRFSISYALTAVSSLLLNEVIFLTFIALFRINVGVEVLGLGLALAVLSVNNFSVTFDKLRENIAEARDVVWSKETRSAYINKALQETMFGHLFTACSSVLLGLLLLCLTLTYIFSISFLFIVVVVVSVIGSYLLMPHIWAEYDTIHAHNVDNRKARKAKRAKPTVKSNEPEEYVFFGIND